MPARVMNYPDRNPHTFAICRCDAMPRPPRLKQIMLEILAWIEHSDTVAPVANLVAISG